ncbi:hypothetical protein H5T53_03635 [Candidatus Bipolaricaulota bacterium]|nr:hypothetical protein [Candidatus Bipolaricaulota bacterium]
MTALDTEDEHGGHAKRTRPFCPPPARALEWRAGVVQLADVAFYAERLFVVGS